MNYSLFKLRFTTPVHFGPCDSALSLYTSDDHFFADTLFSALCHTALSLYGEQGVVDICQQARDGALLLSDSMPWSGNQYYLPKPMITVTQQQELPGSQRKAIKKLKWIPVEALDAFRDSLHGGVSFDPNQYTVSFGYFSEITRACIPRSEQNETLPYQIGIFSFNDNCGLYFIAACQTKAQMEQLEVLVSALGLSGIGGKNSSGYGAFVLEECVVLDHPEELQTKWLGEALRDEDQQQQLLLTTSLPRDEELDACMEDGFFQMVRRGGYVQSATYAASNRKKQTQYFLRAGSLLKKRFCGTVYEIGGQGKHPVYRYSRPVFLGVTL